MGSLFWRNVFHRIGNKTAQVELAKKASVKPTTINNGIANDSIPMTDIAYKIAQALEVSIGELHDGDAGAEFIRKISKNDPLSIHVPNYMQSIVDNLKYLKNDKTELGYILALVEAMAEKRKKNASGQ